MQAIREAAWGKKDRFSVIKILGNIDVYADRIADMVLKETFKTSPYVYETRLEKGKERKLQKPAFYPDQIIHHILIMLIREKLLKRLDPFACASIPHRGQHKGIIAIKSWVRKDKINTQYCLKCDIKKCFENIKPDVVIQEFAKIIKDKKWLRLFGTVIYSTNSLPLGNYMSSWILNILLKHLDEKMRSFKFVSHYIRYMDDFCVFSYSSKRLISIIPTICQELNRLKLQLKSNYQVYNVDKEGIDMLGYRYYRKYTLMRRRNKVSLYKKIKQNTYSLKDCQSIATRFGQLRFCTNSKIREHVYKRINLNLIKQIISDNSRMVNKKLGIYI